MTEVDRKVEETREALMKFLQSLPEEQWLADLKALMAYDKALKEQEAENRLVHWEQGWEACNEGF